MIALNNAATTNAYSRANTLSQYSTQRVNLQVAANGSIFWQVADPDDPERWLPEEFLLPGFYSFDRPCSAVRVRSGAAGVPGRVTVTLLSSSDLGG